MFLKIKFISVIELRYFTSCEQIVIVVCKCKLSKIHRTVITSHMLFLKKLFLKLEEFGIHVFTKLHILECQVLLFSA